MTDLRTQPIRAVRTMPLMRRTATTFLLLVCGCGAKTEAIQAPAVHEDAGGSGGPIYDGRPVGAPCAENDGYVPRSDCPPPTDAGTPVNCIVPGDPPVLERHQLPSGIGYCLTSGTFPHGYFTMNCNSDADCPGGSRCDGSMCWRPCSSDGECQSPTRCLGGTVTFCGCPECDPPPPPI